MSLQLKPTHTAVKSYYETLHQFGQLYIDHEGAVRSAFQTLLAKCGQRAEPKLTLVPEYRIARAKKSTVIVDGALVDLYHLPHGYWEAKDEKDDLLKEVQRKLDKGYPSDNIIFQAPERAILYQNGTRIFDENIAKPEALVSVVNRFFEYKMPRIEEWQRAVDEFSERVPELSKSVEKLIKEERLKSPAFAQAFADFYALCQQAINPNLSEDAVERMLVQHLLTERIFRKIFNNPDFSKRNVVAAEIERVITELTRRAFNRDEFLKRLEPFYHAIESNAENATEFTEKQAFLNTVYERFFQGYSPKEADTHGIVYTPQPIVNFMVRSVEEILQKEFGRSLSDRGVHILDPFVGTGNFIVRIMEAIKTTALPHKYENELHCNEVMLLPYYIASMNIEHEYYARTNEYKPYPGICLVDTFELAEAEQTGFSFITAENAERVKRQKASPIFVIIGNPPYNAWQVNENDNNRNRKYRALDERIAGTYAADSLATNKNALSDPYVKAIRWASDRIGPEGMVAFVTNSGFIHAVAGDGMRKNLARDFSSIYILDLGGNVRRNPKLSGTTHNVFGIQIGVSISFLVRRKEKSSHGVFYQRTETAWTKEQKYQYLEQQSDRSSVPWLPIPIKDDGGWEIGEFDSDFRQFLPVGNPETKEGTTESAIFATYSRGVETTRDEWLYNFSGPTLRENVKRFVETYNSEVRRWRERSDEKATLDNFVIADDKCIKWSSSLKQSLAAGQKALLIDANFRTCLYRPFSKQHMYFDKVLTHRRGQFPSIFPPGAETTNTLICLPGPGSEKPFLAIASDGFVDLHLSGAGCSTQCFPFYTYAEDGSHRRENITDWALEQFRSHYNDTSITKWDIFHYVYAVLHHPEYRQRYAANLRRELPRIPFIGAKETAGMPAIFVSSDTSPEGAAEGSSRLQSWVDEKKENNSALPKAVATEQSSQATHDERRWPKLSDEQKDAVLSEIKRMQDAGELIPTRLRYFRAFVKAGKRLTEIHVHYEQQPEYPLTKVEKAGEQLDYRVTKMKLSKDKTSLIYNQFLTLSGIPKETFDYRLGNRSALEWVIDQYQISTDKRSGITNDPNREDDKEYILRLIARVITVSLETVKIIKELELAIPIS